MSYDLAFHPRARKELSKLPQDAYQRMKAKILALSTDPRPAGARKLRGSDEWRLRVGQWRAVYLIDDTAGKVVVTVIAHRREIYR